METIVLSESAKRVIWTLWGISVGVTLGLSLMLRGLTIEMKGSYESLGMTKLTQLTISALTVGPYLWMIITLLSLESARRLYCQPAAHAIVWCQVTFLVNVAICFVFTYGLLEPFFIVH